MMAKMMYMDGMKLEIACIIRRTRLAHWRKDGMYSEWTLMKGVEEREMKTPVW
jgi:hypothetical protein